MSVQRGYSLSWRKWVYAGPVDGEMNAQTEAALRTYQEKQGLPVSGAADETTLKQLQLELPTVRQGETN
jgi:peptidoglycan hydrolase-like protein with peptidoglycan-binding domain